MNSKSPTNIILDSSVIAKWFFPSEEESEIALKIRDLFVEKEIYISAPTLIYYEINNLIKTAIKRSRVNEKLARQAYQGFLELDLITYSSKELLEQALEKAVALDISSYDAFYLVLAEYLQIPLITADKKLITKANSKLVQGLEDLWI